MKNLSPFGLLLMIGCNTNYQAPPIKIAESNEDFVGSTLNVIQNFDPKIQRDIFIEKDSLATATAVEVGSYGDSVTVYDEMVDLFNPDKFICGFSDKIKDRLKASTRENTNTNGYVPDIVVTNTSKYKKAVKLDGRGANVLVHYFTYELADKKESKPIISRGTPTQQNYSTTALIDNQTDAYRSFFFTMDCSGFFSSSANVVARAGFLGIGKISMDAEGQNTINQSKSVLVIRGLINSPLYAAYVGSSIYDTLGLDKKGKTEVYKKRLATIQGIINAIPSKDQIDERRVYINANYEAIITSNQGSSGYNGTAKLNSNAELNFISGQGGVNIDAKTLVSRKSEYKNFNTYILQKDVDLEKEIITFKKLKDKMDDIKRVASEL